MNLTEIVIISLLPGLIIMFSGCTPMSEYKKDSSVDLNGGFEVSENGLPVNWLMYTPNTVPNADFKIVLDREEFKEGEQSLKFDVVSCSSVGGWLSPGFTNEFFDSGKFEGEGVYKLRIWVKNDGTTFSISAGGVAEKEGDMRLLVESSEKIEDWQLLEFQIDVPEDRWLRLQLNILQPGNFWIDAVEIEQV